MTAKSSRAPARRTCNSSDNDAGGLAELGAVKVWSNLAEVGATDKLAERKTVRVSIRLVEPLSCNRPSIVSRYVARLRAGESAPPILLIRQSGSPYRYRIFDGAHRLRAAKRAGRKTITAQIIAFE
ncbi:ParB N-terminal domain-containing protein [Bradyrhizobium sp. GM2.2]|uniref:ParB N-terminal domain-containing protein n=1 Tax=Bradyrhizobium sp. GM2.2 TaxID=3156358 RepID=UPI00339B2A3F